jgi:uncharacterized protein
MPLTQWQARQKPRIDAELARIVERLRTLDPERVILFGSVARGDFHEDSDIDLVVVLDTTERFIDRISRVLAVVDQIDFDIEPHVYTPREYEELRQRCGTIPEVAEHEGKVLYQRSA